MKAFVAVALAAAAQAAPEADPQLLLAQPSVYLGNAHTQTANLVQHANGAVVPDETLSVKAAKAEHLTAKATAYLNKPVVPVVQTVASVATPVYHGYTGYTGLYNPYTTLALGKREAEAEAKPEADPLTIYNAGLVNGVVPNLYNGVYNYVPTVAQTVVPTVAKTIVKTPVVAKTVYTTPYTGLYSAGLYNHGVYGLNTHLIKREAEAEADPAFYYNNLYGYQYPAYAGAAYTVPAVQTVAKTVVPAVTKTIVKTPVVAKSVYSPYVYSGLYNHGVYGLNTHLIKREADAEADPAVFYNNYYNAPAYTTGLYNGYTGYTGYGINNYAYNPVYGYNNLGYNYLY